MQVPFESDGATVVGKLDKLLFGRDVDLWIARLHDFRFYVGGDAATFFAANSEFYRNIKLYSEMPLRRYHRWFGVTVGAWGWLPTSSRFGFGWSWPQTKGDPNTGEFTIATEWPKLLAMLADAKCPKEVLDGIQPVLT